MNTVEPNIRVFVIDPMALARKLVTEQLQRMPGIEAIGSAGTAALAALKLPELNADVVLVDIGPLSEGERLRLKELLLILHIPVVYFMAAEEERDVEFIHQSGIAPEFLITKPVRDLREHLSQQNDPLSNAIRRAHRSRRLSARPAAPLAASPRHLIERVNEQIIAVGASTGGTEALSQFLTEMPPQSPGIAIVQHMQSAFLASFADRLNSISRLTVKLAEDGDEFREGHVLIAPGNHHLQIRHSAQGYAAQVKPGAPVGGFCPAVDVLMQSVAMVAGTNGIGVILTGMGRDGAEGLLALHKAGGITLAQDEASSIVFGMPREAYENGGAQALVPLSQMTKRVMSYCKRGSR